MPADELANSWDAETPNRRFNLVGGGALLLEPDGFRLIQARSRKRPAVHKYESMTHVYVADRMLLIGTTSGLQTIHNREFSDPETGPGQLRRLLLDRLAARPDGDFWIQEMAEVSRLGDRRAHDLVTWMMVALCVVGTGFMLYDPMLEQFGTYIPELFARGEYWRGVTAQFLHGLTPAPYAIRAKFGGGAVLPIHLALNVGGLLVLGHLVERPLGSWRTAMIVAAGGLGTIAGIEFADHAEVLGASGLVSAFAGAILALEFNFPAALPSYWRLPRRLFLFVLLLQFLVIDQALSEFIAWGAHLGGFAGGFVAAWLLGRPSIESLIPTWRLRLATYAVCTITFVGILGALPLARHEVDALERHAMRLLSSPSTFNLVDDDNAAAWLIATEGDATPSGLEFAVALADRAVLHTGRMNPSLLDTLAEALFQIGDRQGALITIDEAIRLTPGVSYFVEQRRRFTGERPADDRPPPPSEALSPLLPQEDQSEIGPVDPAAPRMTI